MEVFCIGHAAWDVTVRVRDFPAEDSKAEALALTESGGGPAANAAYLLSKWGVRCGFAGIVGDDLAGHRIAAAFMEIGTDITGLELRAGHSTPTSIIVVNNRTSSRTIVTHKAPTPPLVLSQENVPAPKVLLFDGHELTAAREAMQRYPQATTILDAGSLRDGTRELDRQVNYLVASQRFALQITGMASLDSPDEWSAAIAALFTINKRPVVVTLGERGLIHGTDTVCEHLPAFPVDVIDTTGAGDVFHGAFAYGVLHSLPLRENLRLASMAAALSATGHGGRPSIPTLARVHEALAHA